VHRNRWRPASSNRSAIADDASRTFPLPIRDRSLREIQLTRVEQREAVKLAEEQVISAAALDIADDGTVR